MKSPFIYFLVLCITLNLRQYYVFGAPQVPCYFIFGDSLADNGNNNAFLTRARANYRPYGIDFPQGVTGRFSNGRNIPDFIAEYLGFDNYIPPFRNTRGFDILQGVNYASGAAGIRSESGQTMGRVISLDEQLKNHNSIISQIRGLFRNNNNATISHLKKCLYMVEMGSNDYLNNYFLSRPYTTSLQFTPQEYAIALNKQLSSQLKSLYGKGARKFAVFGVGLVGCTPYARATYDTQGSPCVDKINNAIQLFNIGLKSLVDDLNANFTDAKFIFIDIYKISTDDSPNEGIISDAPCCQVKPDNIQCAPFGKVCANRTQYTFWDGVHPTEVGMMALASRSFNAQLPNDTYPFDISQLAQLRLT